MTSDSVFRMWVSGRLVALSAISFLGVSLLAAGAAHACGGGLVSVGTANLGADRQRIFLSVRGAMTDVITEVSVPATTADYAVLLPVPAMPTLDASPVDAADLDTLDITTTPHVYSSSSGSDEGCGCPFNTVAGSANKAGAAEPGDVDASAPIDIGPVTAVVLTADTGDAIDVWLGSSGFVLPADGPALIAAYAGTGRYFIAIRRNDSTVAGGVTSVGVHFTLPGDARTLPLRFSRLGAASTVAFTVFVGAPTAVSPALPFDTLTLTDLDASMLRSAGYAAAMAAAVTAHHGQAFVIEGVYQGTTWASGLSPTLAGLLDPAATLTRLSTILPSAALTTDVALDQPFTGTATTTRYVQNSSAERSRSPLGGVIGSTVFLAAALARRRRVR